MSALLPSGQDRGFSVQKCQTNIDAIKETMKTANELRFWKPILAWWQEQLKFAEKRK